MDKSPVATLSRDAQMLTGAGLDKMADNYPRLFMAMMHHRTTKGDRMTFRDKPWLTAIYKDNSHDMVIIKCSQVHMTEHALCAMFTLANKGKRGMYVLPSKEHRRTFVADRINRLKDYSPLYANAIKSGDTESDSNVYKSLFGHGWKYVGSNVKTDFFEFPCDALFFDEFDLLDQDNLPYAYDRIANCSHPYVWKFGNPTRDNFGIHKEFLDSDQKEWHVTCEHCGHEQILEWETHFVEPYLNTWKLRSPSGQAICFNCHKEFDRLGFGHWIAMNPGVGRVSGYRISRLFTNKSKKPNDIIWLFKKFILAQNDPTLLQNFYNNYLGVTYENVDFKLSKEAMHRSIYAGAKFEYDPHIFRTVMGVDQGSKFTCVISMVWAGELIDIHYANVDRWADVEKLEADFNVVCTVIDAAGGGYNETRDFVKAKGHRWMCYYRPKDQVKTEYNQDYSKQVLETNRTECLDAMVKMILDKKSHVRSDFIHASNKQYLAQMMTPARVTDANGRPVWTKGKDHYFHASAYRYLAFKVSGMRSSVAAGTSWHTGEASESKQQDPKARVIGERPTKDKKSKPKSWSV
ncbi:MAG: phage terminase large subunit family protein [Patescibacteria group bacterium]|jgi:hypothetical protein